MADELIARLSEWASQHSNVTPLDGTDRNSPTFGDLRELLARIEPEAAERGVSEAAIAEVIHDAMVWAAKQGGQPRRWCNGNSIAEGHARQAAATIQSLRSEQEGGHD